MKGSTRGLESLTKLSRPRRFWGTLLTCALVSELVPTQAMVTALATERSTVLEQEAAAASAVATVDGVSFASLAEAVAVAAAAEDRTVTLAADVTLDAPVSVAGTVVLDLAGFEVRAAGTALVVTDGALLTVVDGSARVAPAYDEAAGTLSYVSGRVAAVVDETADAAAGADEPAVRVRAGGALVLRSGALESSRGAAVSADAAAEVDDERAVASVSLVGGAVSARADAVVAGAGSTVGVAGAVVVRSQEGAPVGGEGALELGAEVVAGEHALVGADALPAEAATAPADGQRDGATAPDEAPAADAPAQTGAPSAGATTDDEVADLEVNVGRIDLAAEDVTLRATVTGEAERSYTGEPIVPEVATVTATLADGTTRELTYGRDYMLGAEPYFTNNTDVTAEGATLTIVGQGAYEGVATITGVFHVVPVDLSSLDAGQVSLAQDRFEYGTVPAVLDARLALGDVELASGEGGALAVSKLTPDADTEAGGSYGIAIVPAPGNANLTGTLTVEGAYEVTARSFAIGEVYALPTDDVSYEYDSDALKHVFDGLCVQFDGEDEPALSVADGSLALAFYDITNKDAKPQRLAASPSVPGEYRLVITSRNKSYTTEPAAGIALRFSIQPTEYDKFDVPVVAEANPVYNGRSQHVELAKGTVWGFGWHVLEGGVFGSAVEATDAGSYHFTAALSDPVTTSWSDGSKTNKVVDWAIDALDIAGKHVELCDADGATVTFDPAAQARAAYVKVGDDLISADNFDVVYSDADGATEGKAEKGHALVRGKAAAGNVVGTALVDFEVAKASLEGATLTIDGEAATLTLADGAVVDRDEYVVLYHRVGAAAGDETATVPTAAGSYELRVEARADGNYANGELASVRVGGNGNGLFVVA